MYSLETQKLTYTHNIYVHNGRQRVRLVCQCVYDWWSIYV